MNLLISKLKEVMQIPPTQIEIGYADPPNQNYWHNPTPNFDFFTLDDSHHTGTSEIVQCSVKGGPISFRSILTYYFLYKCIVWSHIFISLLSSMFSSTLLIVCTISVVPVRWLSLSVICPSSGFHVYYP